MGTHSVGKIPGNNFLFLLKKLDQGAEQRQEDIRQALKKLTAMEIIVEQEGTCERPPQVALTHCLYN